MGIALPQWIIEGKNNIWVLGLYGLLFGGALPALVVCHISLVLDKHQFDCTYEGPMVVW